MCPLTDLLEDAEISWVGLEGELNYRSPMQAHHSRRHPPHGKTASPTDTRVKLRVSSHQEVDWQQGSMESV